MRKKNRLVFFPSDPIQTYLRQGKSFEYLESYYNPGDFFDEVYCLSPWGDCEKHSRNKFQYIKASPLQYKKIIAKIRPDVVRAYGGYHCADWAAISKVDRIPTIVSVHDTLPELIFDSIKYADYVICMAETVKESVLKKISFNKENMFVMPNRIDETLFSHKIDSDYRERLNKRFGVGKHILHVGRKSQQKNLDTLIRSLQFLPESVSCVFVGSGESQKYEELAEELNVRGRCYFLESVDKKELPYWYSWCDCFCVPSRWEGFGMVFIEAAGCEASIVTSNIAPMNEYLIHGENAILIDEYEDPTKIAQGIKTVLQGGCEIQQMRKNARLVGLNFSKDKVDREEINIYKKVIRQRGYMKGYNGVPLRYRIYKQYGFF